MNPAIHAFFWKLVSLPQWWWLRFTWHLSRPRACFQSRDPCACFLTKTKKICIRIEFSSRRIIRDTNMEAFALFGDTRWPLWPHVKSLYKRLLVSGYKESCNSVWPPLIIIINFISIASISITVLGPDERSRQECRNFESWIVSRCIHFEPGRHQTLYDGAPDFSVNCNLPNASHVTNYLFICSQLFSPMKKVLHTS